MQWITKAIRNGISKILRLFNLDKGNGTLTNIVVCVFERTFWILLKFWIILYYICLNRLFQSCLAVFYIYSNRYNFTFMGVSVYVKLIFQSYTIQFRTNDKNIQHSFGRFSSLNMAKRYHLNIMCKKERQQRETCSSIVSHFWRVFCDHKFGNCLFNSLTT